MGLMAVVLALSVLGACGSKQKNPALGQADADVFLFQRGTEELAKKHWLTSREYFRRLVDSYPQSRLRADAKLGIGDTYIGEGRIESYILGANEFREFLQFFPSNPKADYAVYRLAYAQSKQMLKPERDQTATHDALRELKRFLDSYPDSKYRPEVEKLHREARDRLSESEFRKGLLYYRIRNPIGAVSRFAELETVVQEPIPRRRPPGGHLCLSPPEPVSAARPAATITAVAPTLPAISQPSSGCRSLLIVYLISFPQHSVGRYQIGGDDLHSTLSTRAAARDQDSA